MVDVVSFLIGSRSRNLESWPRTVGASLSESWATAALG